MSANFAQHSGFVTLSASRNKTHPWWWLNHGNFSCLKKTWKKNICEIKSMKKNPIIGCRSGINGNLIISFFNTHPTQNTRKTHLPLHLVDPMTWELIELALFWYQEASQHLSDQSLQSREFLGQALASDWNAAWGLRQAGSWAGLRNLKEPP